ncbi:MAG: DUF1638 domain-containing protein [Gammaproteobacteria bacterium]|nr:DUF1638 domain-containing protein [Gammaproteobacteria bacterium]MDH5302611.1 DUF1638 domain-containing protein [Gammaproteobacteria bacterium]MDH5322124.1 DUF1638 domain-containing protein [Gammaproteobacteria bacterium]
MHDTVLVIACGALVREITELKERYGWNHLQLKCIDAKLHMRPERIPARLRDMIRKYKDDYDEIFVAYADCGTTGGIDKVLDEEGIKRLPGAHCYQFFAGTERFAALADAEPGTFYLTDFLARHFDQFVTRPLKFEQHPELRDAYFGNYRKLVYLSQKKDAAVLEAARRAAGKLGLEFEHVPVGYGELETGLRHLALRQNHG